MQIHITDYRELYKTARVFLKSKLKVKHGQECGIFVRFDHIVVKESESQIVDLFMEA